jgi:hypothetical protein
MDGYSILATINGKSGIGLNMLFNQLPISGK